MPGCVEKCLCMDAIHFLMGRRWKPAKKVSLLVFAGLLLSWLNLGFANGVDPYFQGTPVVEGLWNIFQALAYTAVGAAYLGGLVVIPLFVIYKLTNLLKGWIQQRAVEEMLCTGLTARRVLDQMFWYGFRWWLIAATPALLLMTVLSEAYTEPVVLGFGSVLYLGFGLVLSWLALYGTAWNPQATGKLPFLGSVIVVIGLPCLTLCMTINEVSPGYEPWLFMLAGLYTTLAARFAAIYALENREALQQFSSRVRRTMRRARPATRPTQLSENPVLAREQMRGESSTGIMTLLVLVATYLLCLAVVIDTQKVEIFMFLLFPALFVFSFRAAATMSQIVTVERENSTLETIRTTPMGSEEFLRGWLTIVVRHAWKHIGALLVLTVPLVLWTRQFELLFNPGFLVAMVVCFALPYLCALVGASIAGQAKPRDEISGQLLLSVGALVMFGAPQMAVSASVSNLALALGPNLVLLALVCWVLKAGAMKSLNRVFLPQK